jgi:tetraacyldisaccharide 4'-kinase
MSAKLEAFFRREWQRSGVWQLVLRPVSWVYGAVVAARALLYRMGVLKRVAVGVPVIVVGNLTAGGAGKTPLVLALAHHLRERKPGVISRGYKARQGTLADEAALVQSRLGIPVEAHADRVEAANTVLARAPETRILIADDGLQHTRLQRDIEIVVVDGARGFGNGALIPAGPLREGLGRLHSVDAIVVNTAGSGSLLGLGVEVPRVSAEPVEGRESPEDASSDANVRQPSQDRGKSFGGAELPHARNGAHFGPKMAEKPRQMANLHSVLQLSGVPVFEMRYGNERFVAVSACAPSMTAQAFTAQTASQRIVAVAGIAAPEKFFAHLDALGLTLNATYAFDDHHVFTQRELSRIDADVIVMTEKDAVKCAGFNDARLVMMQIDALLPNAFFAFIDSTLSRKHHGA